MGNNYLVPVIVVAILIIASAFFTHKYHETQIQSHLGEC